MSVGLLHLGVNDEMPVDAAHMLPVQLNLYAANQELESSIIQHNRNVDDFEAAQSDFGDRVHGHEIRVADYNTTNAAFHKALSTTNALMQKQLGTVKTKSKDLTRRQRKLSAREKAFAAREAAYQEKLQQEANAETNLARLREENMRLCADRDNHHFDIAHLSAKILQLQQEKFKISVDLNLRRVATYCTFVDLTYHCFIF